MSESWEALKRDMQDAGITDDFISRVEAANAASPLRKELGEWKQKAETHAEKAARYERATIGQFLASNGFKGKPDALNIPSDLDPLDQTALQSWAVDMGLIDPPEPSDEDRQRQAEQEAHARVDGASAGTTTAGPRDEARQKALAAQTEDQFWAAAQEAGLATNT